MNRGGHIATRRRKRALLVFFACFTTLICRLPRVHAERLDDLSPLGYINDFARVLTPETRVQLSNLSVELDDRAHAQLVVVTIHSAGGVSIQEFANAMYDRWAIGYKPEDRGALILLAVDDGTYGVAVGQGLGSILTAAKVGELGRRTRPLLDKRDYDHAVLYLTGEVARVIGAERHVALAAQPNVDVEPHSSSLTGLPVAVAALIVLILVIGGFFVVVGAAKRGTLSLRGPGSTTGSATSATFGGFGGGGGFSGFGGGASGGGS
ncbi:MAG TPA: TPM domain-containing protein [Terriglobia bacterium]|nr:TPM domain-containing protein [Terriglobia bacterium]